MKRYSQSSRRAVVALAAVSLGAGSAIAQTSHEVVEYRASLLELFNKCPTKASDFAADVKRCETLEADMIALRKNHRVTNWPWADDKLAKYRTLLHARIMGLHFAKNGRDAKACFHGEKAWLHLHTVSVSNRKEDDFFFKTRPAAHKFIRLCRKENGAPDWGAPMELGAPLKASD